MTKYDLSKDSKDRIKAMVGSSDGFKIANVDLKMRGPGNMMGTKQSGLLELRFVNLAEDYNIIKQTRDVVSGLMKNDPNLTNLKNKGTKEYLKKSIKSNINWSRVS
jgi:ATP-dependent DNA helicase RecG